MGSDNIKKKKAHSNWDKKDELARMDKLGAMMDNEDQEEADIFDIMEEDEEFQNQNQQLPTDEENVIHLLRFINYLNN